MAERKLQTSDLLFSEDELSEMGVKLAQPPLSAPSLPRAQAIPLATGAPVVLASNSSSTVPPLHSAPEASSTSSAPQPQLNNAASIPSPAAGPALPQPNNPPAPLQASNTMRPPPLPPAALRPPLPPPTTILPPVVAGAYGHMAVAPLEPLEFAEPAGAFEPAPSSLQPHVQKEWSPPGSIDERSTTDQLERQPTIEECPEDRTCGAAPAELPQHIVPPTQPLPPVPAVVAGWEVPVRRATPRAIVQLPGEHDGWTLPHGRAERTRTPNGIPAVHSGHEPRTAHPAGPLSAGRTSLADGKAVWETAPQSDARLPELTDPAATLDTTSADALDTEAAPTAGPGHPAAPGHEPSCHKAEDDRTAGPAAGPAPPVESDEPALIAVADAATNLAAADTTAIIEATTQFSSGFEPEDANSPTPVPSSEPLEEQPPEGLPDHRATPSDEVGGPGLVPGTEPDPIPELAQPALAIQTDLREWNESAGDPDLEVEPDPEIDQPPSSAMPAAIAAPDPAPPLGPDPDRPLLEVAPADPLAGQPIETGAEPAPTSGTSEELLVEHGSPAGPELLHGLELDQEEDHLASAPEQETETVLDEQDQLPLTAEELAEVKSVSDRRRGEIPNGHPELEADASFQRRATPPALPPGYEMQGGVVHRIAPPPPPAAAEPRNRPAPPPATTLRPAPAPPVQEPLRRAPEERRGQEPWYLRIFDASYLEIGRRRSPRQVVRQAAFLDALLALPSAAQILDLGCGDGALTIELARRGYCVTGLDLSEPMLEAARQQAENLREAHFVRADMRGIAAEEQFDAILSMGTSFGYFDDTTNVRLLKAICTALKPGGSFLLEVLNRDFAIQEQPFRSWYQLGPLIIMEEGRFDFEQSQLVIQRQLAQAGRQQEDEIRIRLYCLHELLNLLHALNFQVEQVLSSSRTPRPFLGSCNREIVILARKAGPS